MRIYLLSLFILLSGLLQAQTITGKVRFDDDYFNEDYIGQIQIINKRTQQSTQTNEFGEFTLAVQPSDQLLLTSPFIVKRTVTIGDKAFQSDFTIYVDPNLIQLGEVRLHNMNKDVERNVKMNSDSLNKLYKNLGIDPNLRFINPEKDVSKFRGSDLKNPLRLYEHLTGKNKDARQVRAYENKAKMLDNVESLFDKDFYTIELGLPPYKIKEFIRWVNAKQDLSLMLRQSTTEMIKDVFFQRSFEYKRLLNVN